MAEASKEINVFYSWQSDLPPKECRTPINKIISKCSELVEAEFGVICRKDESTRKRPGAPEIFKTICSKIEVCDFFVADITPVTELNGKLMPNSNVVMEFGYALAFLGWDRINLFFNRDRGLKITDLPFDVEKRRINEFSASKTEIVRSAKNLQESIQLVLENNYPKMAVKISDFNVSKHDRDIVNLRRILSITPYHIEDAYLNEFDGIFRQAYYVLRDLNDILISKSFYLYDIQARNYIEEWKSVLPQLLDLRGWIKDRIGCFFSTSTANRQGIIDKSNAIDKFNQSHRELIDYVREKFLELDPDAMNEQATQYMKTHSDY